jgi:hypothetical protein
VHRNLDTATRDAGVSFAYPVYGGSTPEGTYDSVKAGTIATIVDLASSR